MLDANLGQDYSLKPEKSKKTKQKQLLIFAVYLLIDTQSEAKARTRLAELRQMLGSTFKQIEAETDYIIKSFVFPTRNGETKMELVFSGKKGDFFPKDFSKEFPGLQDIQGFSVGDKIEEPEGETITEKIIEKMKSYNEPGKYGKKSGYGDGLHTLFE